MAVVTITAQEYEPADNASAIKFRVKNFGLGVTGTFTGLQGPLYLMRPTCLPVVSW